jgi:hypothetical protein
MICPRCGRGERKKLPFQMNNHEIGCELECYVEVLIYRGLNKEAKELGEIASKLK